MMLKDMEINIDDCIKTRKKPKGILKEAVANINEFFTKNNGRAVNKKVVDALIKSGSFDGLGIKIDKDIINEQILIDSGLNVKNGEVF